MPPSKEKKNLRQRKPEQQPPESTSKTAKSSSKDDDDDWVALQAAIQENKQRRNPLFIVGLGVVLIFLIYLVTHGGSKDITNDDSSKSAAEKNQEQRREEAKDDGQSFHEPIMKPVPFSEPLVTLPHETTAYTQGLCFRPNNSSVVYESTGMYNGESEIRIVDLSNGNVLERRSLPDKYFGEGLTYFEDKDGSPRFALLTWREKTGFVYDADTLELVLEFFYQTTTSEGWGIIYNPRDDNFIVSDGSSNLHFWDRNFRETSKIEVKYKTYDMHVNNLPAKPLKWINELEWDDRTGLVLANIYFQNVIVAIDPDTGYVKTMYDMEKLYTNRTEKADVFNGVALSPNGEVWVTGKYWPNLYQVQLEV